MIIKGCKNCRRRHIKCSLKAGKSACEKCSELGRPCEWEPRFRFKEVHHVYQQDGSSRSRFSFTWDRQQVWMNPPSLRMRLFPETCLFNALTPTQYLFSVICQHHCVYGITILPVQALANSLFSPVDFVVEESDLPWASRPDDDILVQSGSSSAERPPPAQGSPTNLDTTPSALINASTTPPGVPPMGDNFLGRRDSQYSGYYSPTGYTELNLGTSESPGLSRNLPALSLSPPAPRLSSSLAYPEPFVPRDETTRGGNALSPRQNHRQASITPREAFLLRYYVEKIAPWVSYVNVVEVEVDNRRLIQIS